MIENRRELIQFIVEAKQNTYAAGRNFVEPRDQAAHELVYSREPYEYRDAYYGDLSFLGQEQLRVRGRLLLGMNYYGHALAADLPSGFGDFLKEALLKVPAFAPYRGPRYHRSGALEYSCTWNGDLEAFDGFETISADGREIYELHFHGGVVG